MPPFIFESCLERSYVIEVKIRGNSLHKKYILKMLRKAKI